MRISKKLTAMTLIAFCFHLTLSASNINLNLEDVTVRNAIETLQEEYGYSIVFSSDDVDTQRIVSVNSENGSVRDVVQQILYGQNLAFEVNNRNVIVRSVGTAAAQPQQRQITVTGVVTDAFGAPLPGAVVIERGVAASGTATDIDGRFTLRVNQGATLSVAFLGFIPQDVTAGANMSIILQEEASLLDELVVVGFGVQRRGNLTGAVSVISGEELARRPVTNPAALLQSQIPGLRVNQSSGEPGAEGVSFRIRGQGTFSGAGSDPLILINGVPGVLTNIDPNTIESVTVLKDAAAAAVYGARAANGVILITTKTGANQPLSITYRGNFQSVSPTRMFDLVTDPAEYMRLANLASDNSGRPLAARYSEADILRFQNREPGFEGYDWLGNHIGTGFSMNHNLTFMGGSDAFAYNVSLNYINETGTMTGFDFQRYNFTQNIRSQLNRWVTAGSYVNLARWNRNHLRQGAADTFLSLMSQAPTYGPRLPDGRWVRRAFPFEDHNKNIPALVGNNVIRRHIGTDVTGHLWTTVDFQNGLAWHTRGAVSMRSNRWKDWRPVVQLYTWFEGEPAGTLDVGGRGLEVQDTQVFYTFLYSFLRYDFTVAERNRIGLQFGYSQESNRTEWLGARRTYYEFPLFELDAGSSAAQFNNGSSQEWALMGVFGRLNYNFDDRYLFEANFRYDGTSRLAPESRWGFFPSVSAGWRISEEPYLRDHLPAWVNNLQVRASWGQLGNQNVSRGVGPYNWQALISAGHNYTFDGTNLLVGRAQTELANRLLRWETTTTSNIGANILLFRGLNITFDAYRRETTGILRQAQMTGVVGLGAPFINDGAMENRGVELNVQYHGRVTEGFFRGLTYSAGFYIDRYRNRVTNFGAREISGHNLRQEGLPWDSYYVLQVIGIFANQAEIDNAPRQFNDVTRPGDFRFATNGAVDANGNPVVNNDSRIVVPGRFPNFEYAFNASASWRGFDTSIFFAGVDGKRWFVDQWGVRPFVQGSAPTRRYIAGMWTPENPYNATHPKLYWSNLGGLNNTRPSTYFLKDASFLRLKNLTFGYTLPQRITQRAMIQNARIFFSGDNLLTFTNFPELDPERGGDGWFPSYPQNRVLNFGLSVTF